MQDQEEEESETEIDLTEIYIVLRARIPKLLKKGNTYEFIERIKDFLSKFFKASLFCSLFFNSIVTLPTLALWMIANQT